MSRRPSPFTFDFWAQVQKTETCWWWLGGRTGRGYGVIAQAGNDAVYAHRRAYEISVGPIPEGMVIDHLCEQPSCVRPDHLEAVHHGENIRRGHERRRAGTRRANDQLQVELPFSAVEEATEQEPIPELLTIPEAAAVLGISYRMALKAAKAGTIPSIKFGPRTTRIPLQALLELAEDGGRVA